MSLQGIASRLHFIGFRDDRYWSAVKIWGTPDFYHMGWDRRAQLEIEPGDVAIFAKGDEHTPIKPFNYADIIEEEI